jgi:hypothetical protein
LKNYTRRPVILGIHATGKIEIDLAPTPESPSNREPTRMFALEERGMGIYPSAAAVINARTYPRLESTGLSAAAS